MRITEWIGEDKVLASEAARIIGVSALYVRQLVDRGVLPAERSTLGVRIIDRRAVEALAESRRKRLARG